MKCLYCGEDTHPSEMFEGNQLYECKNRHRTGIIIDSQRIESDKIKLKMHWIPDILI